MKVNKKYPLIPLPPLDHMPYDEYYSALIGLLVSSGARVEHGPNWWWYLDSTVFRLTSTALEWFEYVSGLYKY